jgi:hypothetical protein
METPLKYVLDASAAARAKAGWVPYGPPLQGLYPFVSIPADWGDKYVFAQIMGGGLTALLSGSDECQGVTSADTAEFAAEVNNHMQAGYVPLGHAVFANGHYYQIMAAVERARFTQEALKMWGFLAIDHFMEGIEEDEEAEEAEEEEGEETEEE